MSRLFAALLLPCAALLHACSAKASPYKSVLLCDFERLPDPLSENLHYDIPTALKKPNYINHDFRWGTSGYAEMRPAFKADAKLEKNRPLYKFYHGNTGARVRFTVPADYKKNPTGVSAWETGITLATDTYTPLPLSDWTAWRYLTVDVYNPGERDQRLFLRVRDAASNLTQTSALVPAGGASTLEFDLSLLAEARLNVADIRGLTLYLDTAGQDKDPILIFDNLGLHTATVEERRKAEAEEEEVEEEEEDWDAEEEEEGKLKTGIVSRPSGVSGQREAPEAAAP